MKSTTLLILICLLGACKKQALHKIRFEFKVLEQSKYGSTTPIYLSILPKQENEQAKIGAMLPETWFYEYAGLKDGDKVYFAIDIPLSVYYEKWVYIDGVEVAYKRIKVSDSHYYENKIIESRGYEDLEGWGVVYRE